MRVYPWVALALCLSALNSQAYGQDGPALPTTFEGISLSGLMFLTYEDTEVGGEHASQFFIHRAYLTTSVDVLPRLSGRITFDTSQDKEGDGRGDMEVRLKYAYARYDLGRWGPIRGVELEGGIVHMVWLDFEEHINLYRMRDPMFLERTGIFNSADFGLTLGGGFGPELPQSYQDDVSSHYASRFGSFAVGLYNGTGYHGDERNTNKVVQGRLTLRPLPDELPGLQLSFLGISGKGNRSGESGPIPDWKTYDVFLSFQHRGGTLTGQYIWGEGNQKGSWVYPDGSGAARDYSGFSFFGEGRMGGRWRVVAGYDQVEQREGPVDLGFRRGHFGIGYELGSGNIFLVDGERRDWEDADRDPESRVQAVFQVKF